MALVQAALTTPDPHLEVVDLPAGESFKVWAHGYPFRTVRWHFHPEYEIHLVTATEGRAFVGDYIGAFAPGNLVLTGPNLPHNWLTDVPVGTVVPERCLVLQFTADFVQGCAATFRELLMLPALLRDAERGAEFPGHVGVEAEPVMRSLLAATGAARLATFFVLLDILLRCPERRLLASLAYQPSPATYMRQPLNHVLDHVHRNLAGDLRETELAELSGYSPSAFSRAFQKHTGLTFVNYVNGLRIKQACDLLIATDQRITDICHDVGFNNLSNFNRQFMTRKAMAPRDYRVQHRANGRSGQAVPGISVPTATSNRSRL